MKKIKTAISLIICCTIIFSINDYVNAECIHSNSSTTISITYTEKSTERHKYIKQKSTYCLDCKTVVGIPVTLENRYETHIMTDYHVAKLHYIAADCPCEYIAYKFACQGPPCQVPYPYRIINIQSN